MRLTLRTLLAYMDDILDPSDQEELGRKIEASPFATELIHRSRDAVRRLRLSAPEPLASDSEDLHSGDSNLDANTAAEYLDNTLSPEAVAEFERNCLEAGPNADMLLAEAASCHHVLTLVLGEPAEVDADLRQRMYALASHDQPQPIRIEPAHQSPTAGAANGAPVAPAPGAAVETVTVVAAASPVVATRAVAAEPARPEVPDYMLEAARSRRRSRWLAASVVAGALLGSGATVLFWPGGDTKVPDSIAKQTSGVDVTRDVDVAKGSQAPSIAATTGDAPSGPAGGDAPTFVPTQPPAVPPAGAPATAGPSGGGAPPVPVEAGAAAAAPTP
ncbi:MAG TPA: hypothetical protein VEQ85_00450, partial [Lacipirellulaceae bacterium]|nr:hypothetical protein [Lacipirellulaceae bacterium]